MEYIKIENEISLCDPVKGFQFSSTNRQEVIIWYTDWQHRKINIKFKTVYLFLHRYSNCYHQIPENEILEILDSDIIQSLRTDGTALMDEEFHHFVLSTNEDEWKEVVSESIEIAIEK